MQDTSKRRARSIGKDKTALADRIAMAIRKGTFRPGEWLRQIDLEEKFGTTRFDARTALDMLVARELIEHVPNRGYRVYELDEQGMNNLRKVRAILESAAIKETVHNIDQGLLDRLHEIADAFSAAIEEGTPTELENLNSEFHRCMNEASGNPVLNDLIHQIRNRVNSLFIPQWPSQASLRESARQHHEVVAALERREADEAANLIIKHILKT